ncbi:MAG: hypothetical protein ACAH65_11895, partial [Chloroflexota bacterium]
MDVPIAPVPAAAPVTVGAVSERSQARRETIRQLLKQPTFLIGIVVLLGWVLTAILGERITPYDPFNHFFLNHQPPGYVTRGDVTELHLFGTDRLGRDV